MEERQQGARTDLFQREKVGPEDFADHAGIGANTVRRYLKAWDAMAASGLVPARDELAPGDDVDRPGA